MENLGLGWCHQEFRSVQLRDKRLNNRFLKVADDLLKNSTVSIIEASNSWHEAKAAYRLFDNEKVSEAAIRAPHQEEAIKRLNESKEEIFFAIQDTTVLNYTHHPKKEGMGKLHHAPGFKDSLKGCYLHNTLLMTKSGTPLGLIDQQFYQYTEKPASHKSLPITKKGSYRWLKSLEATKKMCRDKNVVTLCDRESDIYEFFMLANKIDAKVLVRASKDRVVFGTTRTKHEKLWEHMSKKEPQGYMELMVSDDKTNTQRLVQLAIRFGTVQFNPPQRLPEAKLEKLEKVDLNVVYLKEEGNEGNLEWMLLTNLIVNNLEEAKKIGQWYKLRWQIESYHRVLKSGCNIEKCRLESCTRLKRYLALKSIIAYRLFYLTMLNRNQPDLPCDKILAEHEWKSLYCHVNKNKNPPERPPSVREAIRLLALLGGFPGRKSDGEPGMTTIWRGFEKLSEISNLWFVMFGETCG